MACSRGAHSVKLTRSKDSLINSYAHLFSFIPPFSLLPTLLSSFYSIINIISINFILKNYSPRRKLASWFWFFLLLFPPGNLTPFSQNLTRSIATMLPRMCTSAIYTINSTCKNMNFAIFMRFPSNLVCESLVAYRLRIYINVDIFSPPPPPPPPISPPPP